MHSSAILDHNNVSAYKYPTLIQIIMGIDIRIGKDGDETPTNNNPMSGGPVSNIPKKKPVTEIQTNEPVEIKQPVKQETQQTKLKQLKDLYDQGLITKNIYIERQRIILDGQ